MNAGKLTIKIKSLVTPESVERLEEEIKDLHRNWNKEASIENTIMGNISTQLIATTNK